MLLSKQTVVAYMDYKSLLINIKSVEERKLKFQISIVFYSISTLVGYFMANLLSLYPFLSFFLSLSLSLFLSLSLSLSLSQYIYIYMIWELVGNCIFNWAVGAHFYSVKWFQVFWFNTNNSIWY